MFSERGQLSMVKHGDVSAEAATDPYTHYLGSVVAGIAAITEEGPLKERAYHFASHHLANPAVEHLFAYVALNAETESHAVDIQMRHWLLQGKWHIAIVSDDRHLARWV